jgi:hypothetical protein
VGGIVSIVISNNANRQQHPSSKNGKSTFYGVAKALEVKSKTELPVGTYLVLYSAVCHHGACAVVV